MCVSKRSMASGTYVPGALLALSFSMMSEGGKKYTLISIATPTGSPIAVSFRAGSGAAMHVVCAFGLLLLLLLLSID